MGRWLLFISLTAVALQAIAQPSLKGFPLTYMGLGPIRFGMSQQQLTRLGFRLSEKPSGYDGCVELDPRADIKILVMLEDDRVTRISSYDPSVQTEAGTKVGTTERQVKQAYSRRVKVKPHQYDEKGHYLVVRSSSGKFAIVHETNGFRVTVVHAGLLAPAQYVEGCL